MRTLLALLASALLTLHASAETLAHRVGVLIASAASAGIRGELDKKETEVVVRDVTWIRRVSKVIAVTPLSHPEACMCCGWRTVYFYKQGEFVISVAAIHGNQLRIYSRKVGGDFPLDRAEWEKVRATLDAPNAANPPPHPTAGTN